MQAFALAERLSVPVMVCVDGFVLTHAMEAIDVPEQEQVDALLPPFHPLQRARPRPPRSRSARWWGPRRSPRSSTSRRTVSCGPSTRCATSRDSFREVVGRDSGGLVLVVPARGRRRGRGRARLRARRPRPTSSTTSATRASRPAPSAITCFRPWPLDEVRDALAGASQVVVLNRAVSVGLRQHPRPGRPARRSPASTPGSTTWSSASVAARSPGEGLRRLVDGRASPDGSPTTTSPSPTSTSTRVAGAPGADGAETSATMRPRGDGTTSRRSGT